MRAGTILASLAGALRGGGVKPTVHLDEQFDLDHLVIEHDEPFPYQLDGDYLGDTERLEFHHVPDAVQLVWPTASPAADAPPRR
jgi:diacylglycerol kinase family enzyme